MFDSTSDRVISKHHEQRVQAEFESRRKRAQIVEGVHGGGLTRQLVEDALRRKYHPDTWAAMKLSSGIQTHNRLMHDILAKVNIEWDGGSRQWLDGPNGSEVQGEEADRFTSFRDAVIYDVKVMKPVSRACWLHPAICVMPTVTYSPRLGMRKFHHVILTPEHFDLEVNPEDPTDFTMLHVYGCKNDEHKTETKTSWSNDEWASYEMVRGKWQETDSGPNLYTQIPCEVFYGEPSVTSVWGHDYGEMLTDMTVEVNCAETLLSSHAGTQIKVLGGEFKNLPQGQVLAQAQPIVFGDGENFNVLDFQTNTREFRDVFIAQVRRQAAVTMGLHADEFDLTGVPPSGEALKMRKWSVELMAAARRQRLASHLKSLYWLDLNVLYWQLGFKETKGEFAGSVLPIHGFDGGWKGGNFTPPAPESVLPPFTPKVRHWSQQEYKFGVDVAETTYPELAAEREAREAYDLRMGFTTRAQLLAQKNPDMKQDEKKNRATITENLKTEAGFTKDATIPARIPFKPNGPGVPNA